MMMKQYFIEVPVIGNAYSIRFDYIVDEDNGSLSPDPCLMILKEHICRLKLGIHFSNNYIQKIVNSKQFGDMSFKALIVYSSEQYMTIPEFILRENDNLDVVTDFVCRLNTYTTRYLSSDVILNAYFK